MNSITRLVPLVTGLVLLLYGAPSWGGPPNPTASDANNNTAGGTEALISNETATGGSNNTAFGFDALAVNTTGSFNTATGAEALFFNTTGTANTATGINALFFNNTGDNNTASGADALFFNTTGTANTASGVSALLSNTTGNANTASGVNALFNNTTGGDNTATGGGSLVNNTTGSKNTAIGVAALNQSTGNKNIAIGFQAGITLTSGNNNIYLGNPGVNSSESQTMRLGNSQTSTFIAGIATAGVNGAAVVVDANGRLGIMLSSARYKRDIEAMGTRSEGVFQLRPVTFAYREDAQGVMHYGLIAEEVAAVYPELVTHTMTGKVQTVRYQELIPLLLNEVQRQRHTLQSQEQSLQRQQQELAAVAALRKELAELRALVGSQPGRPARFQELTVGTTVAQSETDEAVR